MSQKLARTLKLNNGNEIPIVGLGTFNATSEEELIETIMNAYDAGYRHIDTAIIYQNEEIIGKALQKLFAKGVKREELFITTKAWPFKDKNMKSLLEESLTKLQLSYVDLFLVHIPVTSFEEKDGNLILTQKPTHLAWKEFEECQQLGLTKNIGLSNFNTQMILDILTYCQIKPVINQIEVHPYLTNKALIHNCKRFGIQIQAYSSLVSGEIKFGTTEYTITKPEKDILESNVMKELCKKYNKTASQIILCYLTSQDIIVLPKTVKKSRLIENMDCYDWKLTEEEIKQIDQFNCGLRKFDKLVVNFWKDIDLWS